MSVYVDSSALLRRYLDEPGRDTYDGVLRDDPVWVTAQHSIVEVRRNLSLQVDPRSMSAARRVFDQDWDTMIIVELDEQRCIRAAELAELTRCRSLDALHLAACESVGPIPMVTADIRLARAALSLGWPVLIGS